jgi:hypothetical protein
LRSRPPALKRCVKNVENWFYNNDGAILEDEKRFITQNDLISISKGDKSTMRQFLESHIVFRFHWLWKKESPPKLQHCAEKHVRKYSSNERVDTVTTITIFAVGLFILVAPIWILEALQNPYSKLGLITAFLVIFLAVISAATVAKPFESLAATAA